MPFQPVAGRSPLDVNLENEREYQRKQNEDLMLGRRAPGGVLTHGFDALYGAGMRQAEAGNRLSTRGIGQESSAMPSAMRSLRKAAEPEFDATGYQMDRAELDRTLNDNFARKWSQRDALADADRARDPMMQDYEAQRARERGAKDAEAKDTIAGDSFARMEPTRNLARRETRMQAEEMLPYNTKVLEAEQRGESARVAANARVQAAEASAQGRVGSSAMGALARAAGTQSFGDAGVEGRVNDAIGAIRPNVPSGDGLKPLPDEWDFTLILDKFNGNEKQADEWLRLNGYRR